MDQKIVSESVLKVLFFVIQFCVTMLQILWWNSREDLRGWDDDWYSRTHQKYDGWKRITISSLSNQDHFHVHVQRHWVLEKKSRNECWNQYACRFLILEKTRNCNVSLSKNLDQKYDYTAKMMDKFSESWRSVLKCVLSLTSVECSICSKKTAWKRFTTTKNLSVRKYLMKVPVIVNEISIFFSYFQKEVNRISFLHFIISHELTTKLTGHDFSHLYFTVLRNQSLCIHKSFSGFEVSSSSFLQDT